MNGEIDYSSFDFSILWRKLFGPVVYRIGWILIVILIILLAGIVYAFMKYRLNVFRLSIAQLERAAIRFKLFSFLRWVVVDRHRARTAGDEFDQFGLTAYCGRQGAGKTVSMVHYLNRMHKKFPKAIIVTNFRYRYASATMLSWRAFFDVKNGEDGVIFAIDEIHSEFSTAASKDFPESLLSEISQQRKQRIKIVCTAQVFSRIAKPIREQCFSVVQCKTFGGRWTFNREYDAYEYDAVSSLDKRGKVKSLWNSSFVQSDFLRNCYDTYEKIRRMEKSEFIARNERSA